MQNPSDTVSMTMPPDMKPTTGTSCAQKESCAVIMAFIKSEGKWKVDFFGGGVIDIFTDIH